jgi:hypothetical protein
MVVADWLAPSLPHLDVVSRYCFLCSPRSHYEEAYHTHSVPPQQLRAQQHRSPEHHRQVRLSFTRQFMVTRRILSSH